MPKTKQEQERIRRAYPFLRAAEIMGRNLLDALLMQAPEGVAETMYVLADLGREYVYDDIWYIPYDPIPVISARRSTLAHKLNRPREGLIRELLSLEELRRWISRSLHVLRIE